MLIKHSLDQNHFFKLACDCQVKFGSRETIILIGASLSLLEGMERLVSKSFNLGFLGLLNPNDWIPAGAEDGTSGMNTPETTLVWIGGSFCRCSIKGFCK